MVNPDENGALEQHENEPFEGEPKSAKGILEAIEEAERTFRTWQQKSDRIDRLYSHLASHASSSESYIYDREYSLFWATIEVIKPSIYSRPPIPVVVPKFKDRKPVNRKASELLERCAIVGFDISDIDQVMLGVRDDLAINGRGVIWNTYETKKESDTDYERVCIEHIDRTDFLHEPARKWAEVGWVARRAWLSKREMRKRFYKTSGPAYQNADYSTRRDDKERGGADKSVKAGVWEVWNKAKGRVYWVSPGVDVYLDEDEPHLKLDGFFPCPRPAYATLQRRSLVPVPDVVMYEDQLEQINELTSRIHGLIDSLRVKGLYPAGGDVGDAVEMALKMDDDAKVLVPVNAAVLGQANLKDMIVWLPIDQIATTIQACVLTRTQLIEDVYQIVGISDIQRGATDPNETAKAQTIKSQFGAVRVRDKVAELVRIARDTVRIMAEIMADQFSKDTLLDMSQLELPTNADRNKERKAIEEAAKKELESLADAAEQAMASPEMQQQAQANPQEAEAQFKQAQQATIAKYSKELDRVTNTVTVEDVMGLIEDQRIRPFVFDIETDSTIYPDEQAEKTARNEYMQVFAGAATALAPLAMSGPAGAEMAGALIKFQLGPYRAGREIEGQVDEWVKSMREQPDQPNPEMAKIEAEAKARAEELALKREELGLRGQELQLKAQEIQQAPQITAQVEQIKAQANLKAKETDAQVAITREKAQLEADTQTKQMDLAHAAALAAQQAQIDREKMMMDEAFRRDEMAQKERLELAKIEAQRQTARENAVVKAAQPKAAAK